MIVRGVNLTCCLIVLLGAAPLVFQLYDSRAELTQQEIWLILVWVALHASFAELSFANAASSTAPQRADRLTHVKTGAVLASAAIVFVIPTAAPLVAVFALGSLVRLIAAYRTLQSHPS